jgi:hypothetical protein
MHTTFSIPLLFLSCLIGGCSADCVSSPPEADSKEVYIYLNKEAGSQGIYTEADLENITVSNEISSWKLDESQVLYSPAKWRISLGHLIYYGRESTLHQRKRRVITIEDNNSEKTYTISEVDFSVQEEGCRTDLYDVNSFKFEGQWYPATDTLVLYNLK